MRVVTQDRREEAQSVQSAATAWAASRSDVVGLALVGSWARDQADMASDVDLVVLTTDPAPYVETDDWWSFLGEATLVHTKRWGPVTERRMRLTSGLEVEFGLADPEWSETDPVDAGTLSVVRDGMRILYDPHGQLGALAAACSIAE